MTICPTHAIYFFLFIYFPVNYTNSNIDIPDIKKRNVYNIYVKKHILQ